MLRRKLILFNCIFLFGLQAEYVMAIDKITGPWYWIMVKTSSPGGAVVTDEDWIKDGTGGKLTEDKLAKDGITKKIMSVKFKNKLKWKEGEITPTGGNNVNDVLVKIKHAVGDVMIIVPTQLPMQCLNKPKKVSQPELVATIQSRSGLMVMTSTPIKLTAELEIFRILLM